LKNSLEFNEEPMNLLRYVERYTTATPTPEASSLPMVGWGSRVCLSQAAADWRRSSSLFQVQTAGRKNNHPQH
jgi:hypothetical protein